MDIDTTVKLIYAIGITGSVVAVSFFLIRLLVKVGRRVDELERTTENIGEMTDRVNQQMDVIEHVVASVRNISDNVIQPLSAIAGTFRYVKDMIDAFSPKRTSDIEEDSDED